MQTHYTPRTHYTYMDSLHCADSLYPYDSLHLCRLSAPVWTHYTCADSPHPHESPHLRGLTTPAQAHYTCAGSLHLRGLITYSRTHYTECRLITPGWTRYTRVDSLHCTESLYLHDSLHLRGHITLHGLTTYAWTNCYMPLQETTSPISPQQVHHTRGAFHPFTITARIHVVCVKKYVQ